MDNDEQARVANRRRNLAKWLDANTPLPRNPRTLKYERTTFWLLKKDGSFGEKVARRLENDYKMGHMYLDSVANPAYGPERGGEIDIPQYRDVGGGMGGGVTLRDQPGEIQGWRVTPEWITKNIKSHSGVGNLCIVTGFGNSMQPLYNPGDPLVIDTGIKSVDTDAIYFFRVGDEAFVKILQRIPGEGIRVISKNKDYDAWTIKPDMDFEVFGQVLKAWCGTDV